MECEGCNNEYDQEERRPRNLPCGHTFCSSCIGAILKDNKVFCLACHTEHYAVAVVQFPLNYNMEANVRATMMDVDATPGPAKPLAGPVGSNQGQQQGLSKELLALKAEKMKALATAEIKVQATLNGLGQYARQVAKMKEEHLKLMTQLEDLAMFHSERIRVIEEEDARVRELQAWHEARRDNANE